MIDPARLAERFQQALTVARLSQSKFARQVGCRPSNINRVVGGKQLPTLDMLHALSDQHRISATWLLLGEGAMTISRDVSDTIPGHLVRMIELAADGPGGDLRLARLEGYLSSLVAQAADAAAGVDEEAGRGTDEAGRRTA